VWDCPANPVTGTDPNMGRDRGAGRGPTPAKKFFFQPLP